MNLQLACLVLLLVVLPVSSQNSGNTPTTAEHGAKLYLNSCALCHGESGEGDGRMAQLITTPPPFNLTKSQRPLAYLKLIIEKGGEELGRSKQMPAWGNQLSAEDINAISTYLLTIRK